MQERRPFGLDVAAAASAGAALVHAAAAGSHGDENTVQLLFVLCAGLQITWAALALLTTRRLVVAAGVAINAGAALCWLVQRTAGLPLVDALSEPEAVGLQDSLAALLGAVAALGAALSLLPTVARHSLPRGWTVVGGVCALALTLPALAADHEFDDTHSHGGTGGEEAEVAAGHDDGGGHGHGGGGGEAVEVADEDRCDLGFNTAEFNEATTLVAEFDDTHGPEMGGEHEIDFTIDEWAEVFADESLGWDAVELAVLVREIPTFEYAVTSGGFTPVLDPDPWIPMTDPDECEEMAGQLQRTRDAVARYATVADAEAAGYTKGSPMSPGQGAHYTRQDWIGIGTVNLDQPAQLMFSGIAPDSTLVGMAYLAIMPEGGVPDAYAGPNDRFHAHDGMCTGPDGVVIKGGTTAEECADLGGSHTDLPGLGLYMMHTWVVPGCESDWGLFSNANPEVPFIPAGTPFAAGCNSGKSTADRLELDGGSGEPTVR